MPIATPLPEPPPYHLRFGPAFLKVAKRLRKKYPSLGQELADLFDQLRQNPQLGDPLGRDCYKIRLAIRSKGRGKSGGARVITLVLLTASTVSLLTLYDKSEKEDLLPGELDALLLAIQDGP